MKLPILSLPGRNTHDPATRAERKNRTWLGRAASLLLYLPLLIFCVASGSYLYRVYNLLRADLTPIVAAEASRQLHREVRLQRLDLMPLGTLTLQGLRISDGPSFAHRTPALLRVARLTVHYNLPELLFDSSNLAHSLGLVSLDHPILRIERLPRNRYNISDLFTKKSNVNNKPFQGTIQVNNGSVQFLDYLAPATHIGVPAVNELQALNGSVDFISPRHVLFNATGRGAGMARFSTASLHGGASRLHASQYALYIHVDDGDLSYWATYFKNFPQFRVTGGVGSADIQLVRTGPKSSLDLSGTLAFTNGSVVVTNNKVLSAPVVGMRGVARFTMATIQTQGTFFLNGQPIAASGLLYDFWSGGPYVDFTATASNADIADMVAAIPPIKLPPGISTGVGSAQVSFVGPLRSPAIDGDLVSPRFAYMGHEATDLIAHFHYYNKVFEAPSATCQFPDGGTATANLLVDSSYATPLVKADGAIRGYNLKDLLQRGIVADTAQLTGRGDFDFIADNSGGPLILRSNIRSANFSVFGLSELQGAGRITWPNGSEIHVDRLVARGPQGTLAATGDAPVQTSGQSWNLALDATGIDLNLALKPYLSVPVQGLGSFHGTLTGASGAPDVAGKVEVFGGRYGRFSFDSVAGNMIYSGDKVALSNVLVRRYPTQATVSGSIVGLKYGRPDLNVNVDFAQADVQDFDNLVRQFNAPSPNKRVRLSRPVEKQVQVALSTLTGTAEGQVHITGGLAALRADGEATVTDATVGAYRVDRARANFDYRDSDLHISRGLVSIEGSDITASGSYKIGTGQVSGNFAGTRFDLSRFRRIIRPFADVNGILNFSGSISGTLKHPVAAVGLVAQNVTINRQQLEDFSAFGRYDDGTISLTGDPWVFTIVRPASVNAPAGTTTYRIDSFKLALPGPSRPGQPTYLDIQADIPEDSPETVRHFIETLEDSSLASTPAIQAIMADYAHIPSPFTGSVSADTIKVFGNLDALSVSTVAHVTGLTVGQFHAQTADITLNSSAARVGTGPVQRVSSAGVTAQQIVAEGLPIDSVTATAGMNGRVVTLTDFRATSNKAYLDAEGTANLEGDMSGSIDASGIPLSLFNVYLPKTRALTGQLSSLTLQATGPTKSPNLTASVELDKPAITLRAPEEVAAQTYSLDRIRSGSITFNTVGSDGDRELNISNLSAYRGGSPVAVLSGTIPLKWNPTGGMSLNSNDGQPFSAQLTVQDLGAVAALIPAVDPAKTQGSLVATLGPAPANVEGGVLGTVNLTNGSLGFVGVNTSLTKIQGAATFNASSFKIGTFTSVSSATGALSLTGGGTFGDTTDVDMKLAATKFAVNESGSQTLLAKFYGSSAHGAITGDVQITGSPFHPLIASPANAPIVVAGLTGTIPAPVTGTATEPALYPVDPDFDIALSIGTQGAPARLSNPLITAEAGGIIHVGGELSNPTMHAVLTVYAGKIVIPPTTTMKFVRPYGEIKLNYPVPVTDEAGNTAPTLEQHVDINAEATVYVRRSTLAAYQPVGQGTVTTPGSQPIAAPVEQATAYDVPVRYVIDAHIYGELSDPHPNSLTIDMSSNPDDLSKPQMYAALGGYSSLLGPNGLQDELNNLFSGVVLPGLLGPAFTGIENGLGLSDFSFDYAPNVSPSVTLTKALTQRIYITYIQSFGARDQNAVTTTNVLPLYTIKLSYSLSNRLQFSYSTDSQHEDIIALEGVYGF